MEKSERTRVVLFDVQEQQDIFNFHFCSFSFPRFHFSTLPILHFSTFLNFSHFSTLRQGRHLLYSTVKLRWTGTGKRGAWERELPTRKGQPPTWKGGKRADHKERETTQKGWRNNQHVEENHPQRDGDDFRCPPSLLTLWVVTLLPLVASPRAPLPPPPYDGTEHAKKKTPTGERETTIWRRKH